MKKIIIFTLLTFSISANAQFGDLMKGLEKLAKELDGASQQQQVQPEQGSQQQQQQQQQLQQNCFSTLE